MHKRVYKSYFPSHKFYLQSSEVQLAVETLGAGWGQKKALDYVYNQ